MEVDVEVDVEVAANGLHVMEVVVMLFMMVVVIVDMIVAVVLMVVVLVVMAVTWFSETTWSGRPAWETRRRPERTREREFTLDTWVQGRWTGREWNRGTFSWMTLSLAPTVLLSLQPPSTCWNCLLDTWGA